MASSHKLSQTPYDAWSNAGAPSLERSIADDYSTFLLELLISWPCEKIQRRQAHEDARSNRSLKAVEPGYLLHLDVHAYRFSKHQLDSLEE